MPKVSICIPAYNQTIYLKNTLDSIIGQSFTDYEVIITDDSTSDLVEKLISTYDFHGKLRYFRNSNQLGTPENWNESIRRSEGKYIKILHHDDFLNGRNSLHSYVKMLDDNPNDDFAFTGSNNYDSDFKYLYSYVPSPELIGKLRLDPDILFSGSVIGSPSATIFRNGKNLLFDNNLKWLVDSEFYIRWLRLNRGFVFDDNCLVSTVAAKERVTNQCFDNPEVEIFEMIYVLNKILKGNIHDFKFLKFLTGRFIQNNIMNEEKLSSFCKGIRIPELAYFALVSANLYKPVLKLKKALLNRK